MKLLIRADASHDIGSGHIMRCLTLAQALRQAGHEIRFLSRTRTGHLNDTVAAQGFPCQAPTARSGSLKTNAEPETAHAAWLGCTQAQDFADCAPHIRAFAPDWIICDHYALSAPWQTAARTVCGSRIMVIDDLADRRHDADLLLDQTHGRSPADYAALVPPHCRILAGTRYALLRDEFRRTRAAAPARTGSLKNILLNLGGVDKDNTTLAVLRTLSGSLKSGCTVTVVMGAGAPHTEAVRAFAQTAPYPCRVIAGADNMAQLMAQADLSIGAAGSTAWERCCMGLSGILLVLADNQRTVAARLHTAGAAVSLETADIGRIPHILADTPPQVWQQRSRRAAELCDGNGTARTVRHLAEPDISTFQAALRPACPEDSSLILSWRNSGSIRRMMFNADPIPPEQHAAWFTARLHDPDFKMYVYTVSGKPAGYGSLKRTASQAWEWGFYLAPECPHGQGHGSRLCRLLLQRAFGCLNAAEVHGQALSHNAASIALHRKLGFRQPESSSGNAVSFVLRAEECLE